MEWGEAVQPSRPGTNAQSRNRGSFVWCSVGEGVLPAATLCDRGGLNPPQRPAAIPKGLAREPVIFSLPPPSTIICLPLVFWGSRLLEEPRAAINLVCRGPTVRQHWARHSTIPAGQGQ